MYVRKGVSGSITYLLLYVNCMLIVTNDISRGRKGKCLLCEEFEMKDLGTIMKILGMKILRDVKAI